MRDEVNVLFGTALTNRWDFADRWAMKLSSWWWDFADRCDMKVSRWVLALFLVSAPVLMCGSAFADGSGCNGCKSEDVPPLGQKTAPPVPWLTAPEPADDVADDCSGSSCLYSDEDTTDPDQRRAPPPETVRECTSSNC
jgi:hypothetical protein